MGSRVTARKNSSKRKTNTTGISSMVQATQTNALPVSAPAVSAPNMTLEHHEDPTAAVSPYKIPTIELPRYNQSDPAAIYDFIYKFKHVITMTNWSPATALELFATKLEGPSLAWFRSTFPFGVPKNTTQEIFESTIKSFQAMFQKPVSLVQAFKTHQRVGEDVVSYAFRLSDELVRAEPQLSESVRTACFIGGLLDDIKQHVSLQDSSVKESWNKVLTTAKNYEDTQLTCQPMAKAAAVAPEKLTVIQSDAAMEYQHNEPQYRAPRFTRFHDNTRFQRGQPRRFPGKCFRCNRFGHKWELCHTRLSKREQQEWEKKKGSLRRKDDDKGLSYGGRSDSDQVQRQEPCEVARSQLRKRPSEQKDDDDVPKKIGTGNSLSAGLVAGGCF